MFKIFLLIFFSHHRLYNVHSKVSSRDLGTLYLDILFPIKTLPIPSFSRILGTLGKYFGGRTHSHALLSYQCQEMKIIIESNTQISLLHNGLIVVEWRNSTPHFVLGSELEKIKIRLCDPSRVQSYAASAPQ